MFVVDASMTLAWCLDDEVSDVSSAVLRRLLLEGAIAPAHWALEVGNGLRFAERRGRIERATVDASLALLAEIQVDLIPVGVPETARAVEVAARHDLSVYDAAYLALASERGLGLATLDQGLATAARVAGVRLVA